MSSKARLTQTIAFSDPSEPYFWIPDNSAAFGQYWFRQKNNFQATFFDGSLNVALTGSVDIGSIGVANSGARLTAPPGPITLPESEVIIGTMSVAATLALRSPDPVVLPASSVAIGSIGVATDPLVVRVTVEPTHLPEADILVGTIGVAGDARLTDAPARIQLPQSAILVGLVSVTGQGRRESVPVLPAIDMLTAEVGAAFAFTLPEADYGNAPLVYSISQGLRGWMAFAPATRVFSGTGQNARMFTLTYRVQDADGDADTREFVLAIVPPDTIPTFLPFDDVFALAGSPFSSILPAPIMGNAPITLVVVGRPAGVAFNATTRRLSGTLADVAIHPLTYRATDADGDVGERDFNLHVAARESLPPNVPWRIDDWRREYRANLDWRSGLGSPSGQAAARSRDTTSNTGKSALPCGNLGPILELIVKL